MRIAASLLSLVGIVATGLSAATVQFGVTPLGSSGPGQYRYQYTVSNVSLAANQELAIYFDPLLFSNLTLTNSVMLSGFDLEVFQPNNPPGAVGEYSAYALVDHPSLAGPFTVDFNYLGVGIPGPQSFAINQYTSGGQFQSIVNTGITQPIGTSPVPEPSSFSLGGLMIGVACGCACFKGKKPYRN